SATPSISLSIASPQPPTLLLYEAPDHPPPLHSFPTRRSSDLNSSLHKLLITIPLRSSRMAPTTTWVLPNRPRRPRSRLGKTQVRSEEHTSELQSRFDLVCRLLLAKKNSNVQGLALRSASS